LLRGGTILEGATVEGCYRCVDVPLASFVSFPSVGHVCVVAPAFFFCLLELLYGVVAIFIKRGKSLFRGSNYLSNAIGRHLLQL
jgi:hypothetical protein